jgi:hypothetical protein
MGYRWENAADTGVLLSKQNITTEVKVSQGKTPARGEEKLR